MSNLMRLEKIPDKIKSVILSDMNINKKRFIEETTYAIDIWNNNKNSYLRKATEKSFFNAIFNIHKIGLTLNPVRKEAYLIPRKNFNDIEVCLEPSYIGLIKLLTDAGVIKNIQTVVVYEGDEFSQFYDINGANFKHTPYYVNSKDKGKIKGVYCLAFLTNNNTQFEYMDIDELNNIKEKSESYKAYKSNKVKSAIWVDYEGEMVKKTILRRIYKYLPKSGNKCEYIDNAISLDESAYMATDNQIKIIDSLIHTSILPEDQKQQIEREYGTMTSKKANDCIYMLKNNQLPDSEMSNMSMGNISNILKEKTFTD